ncbi:MAG: ABC transporter substrate-binding protein [Chitinophagales bacterium]|nr:ABC transporter substrate-binding protein [Chitinophagales bacterium]
MKKIIYIIAVLFIVSCNSNGKQKSDVFKLNISAGLTSLDPAFAKDQATMWCDNQIYNGLVQIDEQLNVQPCIAKSWTITEDGKTYTFHLRNDVFFHDNDLFKDGKGRKVTASDFVYSFNRIIDTTIASTGAWLFNGKVIDENPFVAIDDTTLQIQLQHAFRPFLGLLTLQYCSVVPKEVVDHFGKDFRANPCGTGPFKMVRWEENNVLILTKNDNYFEHDAAGKPLPYLNGIRISFIADKGAEFNQFAQGKLDFMTGLDVAYKDKLLSPTGELLPEWKDKLNFIKMPYMNTEYLGISMGKQPCEALKNQKVRQALNYAIDRKKMIEYLRNGIGVPAINGIIPAGMADFDANTVKGYDFDIEKAKQLLAEAGYPNGNGVDEITIYSNPTYQDLITFIAKEFKNIGIKTKIENTPAAFLREAMRKNEVEVFRASWIGDYPDGENYLSLFYSGYGAPPNYTFYKNTNYDKLYEQAISTIDDAKAKQLYHQLENIMIKDAPIIPLYYDEITRFVHKNVKGLPNNAMNLLVLKTVALD